MSKKEIQIATLTIFFYCLTSPVFSGLSGFWCLNEGSGSGVADFSGNANSGTITGAVWSQQTLVFDGDDDYVSIPDSNDFSFDDAFMISADVKPDTNISQDGRIIYQYDQSTGDGYFISYKHGSPATWMFGVAVNGTTKFVYSNDVVAVDAWTHLKAVRDENGSMKLYINGNEQSGTDTLSGAIDSSGNVYLGVDYNHNFDFKGSIKNAWLGTSDKFLLAGINETNINPSLEQGSVNSLGIKHGLSRERYFTQTDVENIDHDFMVRSLVLDNGTNRIVLAVVDNLFIPRDLLDNAKEAASTVTGIPADHMLISATHTHSGPSVMGALGVRKDPLYSDFLADKITESINMANGNLIPAKIGWTKKNLVDENGQSLYNHTRAPVVPVVKEDIFGNTDWTSLNDFNNEIMSSGPDDTEFSIISVFTLEDKPLVLFGNYAWHSLWETGPVLSPEVPGYFSSGLKAVVQNTYGINPDDLIVMLSQGTSGDTRHLFNEETAAYYAQFLIDETESLVYSSPSSIEYYEWLPLDAIQKELPLAHRQNQFVWAEPIINAYLQAKNMTWSQLREAGLTDTDRSIIWAREQRILEEEFLESTILLQAIRIGNLGITAIPHETFGITGLKIKDQSPFEQTINVSLANGSEGYLPPPERFPVGGYTTYPCRTSPLEKQAEPKETDTLVDALNSLYYVHPPYRQAVLDSQPLAYWPLDDYQYPCTKDIITFEDAYLEEGVVPYCAGGNDPSLTFVNTSNRLVHSVGGRIYAPISPEKKLGNDYTFECLIWNGLPNTSRSITGYFFSRGIEDNPSHAGDHLCIGGTTEGGAYLGKLCFFNGVDVVAGTTVLSPETWYHIVLTRDNLNNIKVYLNGNINNPEINIVADSNFAPNYPTASDVIDEIFIGGRLDNLANFVGKIDEVAIYNRVLTTSEIQSHCNAVLSQ